MKRPITATGLLTLVAMIAVGAFSTGSALAGGGPNSFFLWTGPLPGLVLVLSTNPQIFEAVSGTEINCKHFRGHGILSNGKAMTAKGITLTGIYSSCTAAGGAVGAEVTPVEYLVSADGSVAVDKPIVITIPELGCSLKINNGPPNNNLRLILYLNEPKAILAHVEVKGINSLSSGGLCGEAGVEKTEGTYRGLFLVSVHGGSIQWDPK